MRKQNYLNNNIWEGEKTSIAVSDINNDTRLDLIIGAIIHIM